MDASLNDAGLFDLSESTPGELTQRFSDAFIDNTQSLTTEQQASRKKLLNAIYQYSTVLHAERATLILSKLQVVLSQQAVAAQAEQLAAALTLPLLTQILEVNFKSKTGGRHLLQSVLDKDGEVYKFKAAFVDNLNLTLEASQLRAALIKLLGSEARLKHAAKWLRLKLPQKIKEADAANTPDKISSICSVIAAQTMQKLAFELKAEPAHLLLTGVIEPIVVDSQVYKFSADFLNAMQLPDAHKLVRAKLLAKITAAKLAELRFSLAEDFLLLKGKLALQSLGEKDFAAIQAKTTIAVTFEKSELAWAVVGQIGKPTSPLAELSQDKQDNLIKHLSRLPQMATRDAAEEDPRIANFLREFIVKSQQPDEVALGKIIAAELGQHLKFAGDEYYLNLQERMFTWIKDRTPQGPDSVITRVNVKDFFKQVQAAVMRLHLVGYSLHYRASYLPQAMPASLYPQEIASVTTFIQNQQAQACVYILSADELPTAAFIANAALQQAELADDQWGFIDAACCLTPQQIGEALAAQPFKILLLNQAHAFLSTERWPGLEGWLRGAQTHHKKIILLIESKNSTLLINKMSGISFEQQDVPQLEPAQINTLVTERATQQITVLGRQVNVASVLQAQTSALYQTLRLPHTLTLLLASGASSVPEPPASVLENFIDGQAIHAATPVYALTDLCRANFKRIWLQTEERFSDDSIARMHNAFLRIDLPSSLTNEQKSLEVLAWLSEIVKPESRELLENGQACLWVTQTQLTKVKAEVLDLLGRYTGTIVVIGKQSALDFDLQLQPAEDLSTHKALVRVVANPNERLLPTPIKFIAQESTPIERADLLKRQTLPQLTVLASSAGTGKSYNLNKLRELWRQDGMLTQFDCVVLVHLAKLDEEDFNSAPAVFLQQYFTQLTGRELTAWDRVCLEHALAQHSVLLLADGWDEVLEEKQSTCQRWLQQMAVHISIIIGTRPYAQESLALVPDHLLELQSFTRQQINDYLYQRLMGFAQAIQPTAAEAKCREFASALSQRIDPSLAEVIGVPLQCFLFTEMLKPKFLTWLGDEHAPDIDLSVYFPAGGLDRAQIYQYFIAAKLELYFPAMRGMSISPSDAYAFAHQYLQLLKGYAFQQLFQQAVVIEMQVANAGKLREILPAMGLVANITDEALVPFHPTYFEYFAAAYLAQGLSQAPQTPQYQQAWQIIQLYRFTRRYEVVWQFMHAMIAHRDPVLFSIMPLQQHATEVFLQPEDQIGVAQQRLLGLINRGNPAYVMPAPRPTLKLTSLLAPLHIARPQEVIQSQAMLPLLDLQELQSAAGRDNFKKLNLAEGREDTKIILRELENLPSSIPFAQQALLLELLQNIISSKKKRANGQWEWSNGNGYLHMLVIQVLASMTDNQGALDIIEKYLTFHNSRGGYRKHSEYVVAALFKTKDKLAKVNQRFPLLLDVLVSAMKSTDLNGNLNFVGAAKVVLVLQQWPANKDKQEVKLALEHYLTYSDLGYSYLREYVLLAWEHLQLPHTKQYVEIVLAQAQDSYEERVPSFFRDRYSIERRRPRRAAVADELLAKVQPDKEAGVGLLLVALTSEDYPASTRRSIAIGLCGLNKSQHKTHVWQALHAQLPAYAANAVFRVELFAHLYQLGLDCPANAAALRTFAKQYNNNEDVYIRLCMQHCLSVLGEDTMLAAYIETLGTYSQLPGCWQHQVGTLLDRQLVATVAAQLCQMVCNKMCGRYDFTLFKRLLDELAQPLTSVVTEFATAVARQDNRHIAQEMVAYFLENVTDNDPRQQFFHMLFSKHGLPDTQVVDDALRATQVVAPEHLPETIHANWWRVDAGLPIIAEFGGNYLNSAMANYLRYLIEQDVDDYSLQECLINLCKVSVDMLADRLPYLLFVLHTFLQKVYVKGIDKENLSSLLESPGSIQMIMQACWRCVQETTHEKFALAVIYQIGFIFAAPLVCEEDAYVLKFIEFEQTFSSGTLNTEKQQRVTHCLALCRAASQEKQDCLAPIALLSPSFNSRKRHQPEDPPDSQANLLGAQGMYQVRNRAEPSIANLALHDVDENKIGLRPE